MHDRTLPCSTLYDMTDGRAHAQVYAQVKFFIPDPIKNDVAYQARAQPFLVFGLLTTGLAIGHHNAAMLGM